MYQFQPVDSKQQIPKRLEIEHLIWQQNLSYIAGVDEAGRGPLAGPVVAAAVIFPSYIYIPEVRDSKKLTEKQREEIYSILLNEALAHGIGIISPQEIDKINIHQATFKAMRKAIGSLSIQPDYIIYDGYELPEKFFRQEAIINGDDHSFTIAAASIIAKVTRDRLMIKYHQEFPRYGFNRHKGYGTAFHREAVRKFGPISLHRRTFLKKIL